MRRSLITALLLLVALAPVGIVVAGDSVDPGPPAWGAGGESDAESVPAEFGVHGPDGSPVVCANGKELRVRKEKLLAPPPHPSRRIAGTSDGYVWRCGNGSDPHRNARLVPESEDPLARADGGSG